MVHPALRMSMVPSTKIVNKCQPGHPWAATHNADSEGHNRSNQPAGRSQRTKSK
jgi:hypothetical protein